jgi:hypothetical protein
VSCASRATASSRLDLPMSRNVATSRINVNSWSALSQRASGVLALIVPACGKAR